MAELADTPEARRFLEAEFPALAEFNPTASRRDLFRVMGASMMLAGLAACDQPREALVPYVRAPENQLPGEPRYYATAVLFEGVAQPVLAETSAAIRMAAGEDLALHYRLTEADVIVALEEDFLRPGPAQLLFTAECTPSLTGAQADRRLAAPGARIPARTAALAQALDVGGGLEVSELSLAERAWVADAAAGLRAAGERGLVMVGAHQDPAVQALGPAINGRLGAVGSTLAFTEPVRRLGEVFPWAAPGAERQPHIAERLPYLNEPFFIARTVLYLAILIAVAVVTARAGRSEHRTAEQRLIGGIGIIALTVALSFMAVDWVLSLDPRFDSSVMGLLFVHGCVLAGFGYAVIAGLGFREGGRPLAEPAHKTVRALGSLAIAGALMWVYLAVFQFLVIWSAEPAGMSSCWAGCSPCTR